MCSRHLRFALRRIRCSHTTGPSGQPPHFRMAAAPLDARPDQCFPLLHCPAVLGPTARPQVHTQHPVANCQPLWFNTARSAGPVMPASRRGQDWVERMPGPSHPVAPFPRRYPAGGRLDVALVIAERLHHGAQKGTGTPGLETLSRVVSQ